MLADRTSLFFFLLCLNALVLLTHAGYTYYTTNTITDVGGAGCYPEVVDMIPGQFSTQGCPLNSTYACQKQMLFRNSSLAPFDEELTMVFGGPLTLFNLAVYQPDDGGSTWNRVSYWDPSTTDNVVWLNNNGGGASGSFSICGGNSQSFANYNATQAAASPQQINGIFDHTVITNAMSGVPCGGSGCGSFYRNVSYHGWNGDSLGRKLFAVNFIMPNYTLPAGAKGNTNISPAYWILNAKIMHTAQFGCNCRGEGCPGGCGELDVAEIITGGNQDAATSTIYSFRGCKGSGNSAFMRPYTTPSTFLTIFNSVNNQGTIQLTIDDTFDFTQTSLAQSAIDTYMARTGQVMSLAGQTPTACPANPIIGTSASGGGTSVSGGGDGSNNQGGSSASAASSMSMPPFYSMF